MTRRAALAGALVAVLLAAASLAAAKAPEPQAPQTDPNGIIDLPPGYTYTVLAVAGETKVVATENGQTYDMPDDFDANVTVKGKGNTTWLLSSHELTEPRAGDFQGDAGKSFVPELATTDDGDSNGWGSVSRLLLGKGGKTVLKAELITTGLHNLCAGAKTPWGSFLVNEEFPFLTDPEKRSGWVWEIDPATGKATRVTGMGRFSHEQEARLSDGSWLLTDDRGDFRFLYRFVPDRGRSLASGKLFALKFDHATNTGTWVGPLDPMDPYAGLAAVDRNVFGFQKAEGIVTTPDNQGVVFSESGSGAFAGRVWKLTGVTSASVKGEVLVEGSFASLSRPDNLRFNGHGDLLILEDNGSSIGTANGGVNEIRILPKGKTGAENTVAFARLPNGGEPTGPWFSRNGKQLYLSIQGSPGRVIVIDGRKPFGLAGPPPGKGKGHKK